MFSSMYSWDPDYKTIGSPAFSVGFTPRVIVWCYVALINDSYPTADFSSAGHVVQRSYTPFPLSIPQLLFWMRSSCKHVNQPLIDIDRCSYLDAWSLIYTIRRLPV